VYVVRRVAIGELCLSLCIEIGQRINCSAAQNLRDFTQPHSDGTPIEQNVLEGVRELVAGPFSSTGTTKLRHYRRNSLPKIAKLLYLKRKIISVEPKRRECRHHVTHTHQTNNPLEVFSLTTALIIPYLSPRLCS